MKKYILAILVLSTLTSFGQEKLNIISSASIFNDMAENIIKDKHHLEAIVPIGGDPHLHTPTPRDAKLVTEADLILVNGLSFEGWINELIANSGSKAKVVTITEGVNKLSSDKFANSTDPHAWMDASNGLVYADNIYKSIVELDPANEAFYTENHTVYRKEIEDLDNYITNEIRKIPLDQRVLITSHDAFAYYGQRYGIRVEALVGISTEAQAGTDDMMRIKKVINENKVPAIFVESTINPKLINQIAKDNNVIIGGELFADSIGDEESDAFGYVEMLNHNTQTIVGAMTKSKDIESAQSHNHGDQNNNNIWLYLIAGLLLVGGFVLAFLKLNK